MFYRPVSLRLTWVLARTAATANGVSYVSLLAALGGLTLWLKPGMAWALAGALALQLSTVLDHVDGELSRWRGTSSLGGLWLDKMVTDVWVHLALFFTLPAVVYVQTGDGRWLVAGAVLAFSKAVAVGGFGVREALTERRRADWGRVAPGLRHGRDVGALGDLVRGVAAYWWEATKAINLVSLLIVADAAWAGSGRSPYVWMGVPFTFTALYAGLGAFVLVGSILAELVAGSRGPAPAELEPYR